MSVLLLLSLLLLPLPLLLSSLFCSKFGTGFSIGLSSSQTPQMPDDSSIWKGPTEPIIYTWCGCKCTYLRAKYSKEEELQRSRIAAKNAFERQNQEEVK